MMKFVLFLAIVVACSAFMPHRPLVNGRTALMAKVKAEVVGKSELVSMLKDATGVSKKDIGEVLAALNDVVKSEVLDSGKEIRLRDFGTFKQKVSKPRVGRNPRTGEELQISGSKSVSFSVSSTMKEKM